MSSTDKEKDMIKEWACRAESMIESFDVERESFWSEYESERDIVDYEFETVPDLKNSFRETLRGCDDVILPMCVATFKKKEWDRLDSAADISGEKKKDDDFSIPEFIYVF